MALKLGMNFIKYTLLLISFLYMLTASVLATIGGTVMERFSFSYFFEDDFVTVGRMLFFTGIILLFVSLLGVVAAGKESTLLVNIFGCFIIAVLFIEVIAIVIVNKVKEDTNQNFANLYSSGMVYYNEDIEMHTAYDYLHRTFACCGLDEYTEWLNVAATENHQPRVPDSCCSIWGDHVNASEPDYLTTTTIAENYEIKSSPIATCQRYYSSGCSRRVEVFLNKKSTTMGLTAIILTQLIGLFLIITLGKAIRGAKTEREVQKWQLKQKMATQMQSPQMPQKEDIHPKGIRIPSTEDSQA